MMHSLVPAMVAMLALVACSAPPEKPENAPEAELQDIRLLEAEDPLTPGPLRALPALDVGLPSSPYSQTAPDLSPDGKAYFSYDGIEGLWVMTLHGEEGSGSHAVGRVSTEGFALADTVPYAWAANSRSIFGVRQKTADPGGFALGPKETIAISPDGTIAALPALSHPAGNLDGIYWVGHQGRAIAEFGTKGSFYRPEFENSSPTFAMVDARAGRIIQSYAIPRDVSGKFGVRLTAIDARLAANGGIFAVYIVPGETRKWFVWEQGSEPKRLPWTIDTAKVRHFAIAPDLKHVLVVHHLSAVGPICELWTQCPPPESQDGIVAELRELASGRVVWTLDGTADNFSGPIQPAISPDGRHALVSLPVHGQKGERIALISMSDGRVLQEVAEKTSYQTRLSFSEDGRDVTIAAHSTVRRFRFAD